MGEKDQSIGGVPVPSGDSTISREKWEVIKNSLWGRKLINRGDLYEQGKKLKEKVNQKVPEISKENINVTKAYGNGK